MHTNPNPPRPGVVVGVDATAQSGHAVRWAAREAADRGVALTPAPIDFAFRTAARLGLGLRAVRAFQPATAFDGDYADDVEIGRKDALIGMATLLHRIREQYPDVPITPSKPTTAIPPPCCTPPPATHAC